MRSRVAATRSTPHTTGGSTSRTNTTGGPAFRMPTSFRSARTSKTMIKVLPKFDKYTVYARLFPAIIAGAPAIALAWAVIAGKEVRLVQAIAGTALAVLLIVLADVARRRGKAIEPRLITGMGGLPSITMLRHGDTTFDAATKVRIH